MMQRLWTLLAGLLLISALLISNSASADDSRPGYLELKEITANRYSVLWRTPLPSLVVLYD